MGVSATHPQYDKFLGRWILTRDVINSEAESYIPDIDVSDQKRCKMYRDMAILTNFTSRTKNGLVGAAMRKAPEMDFPQSLEYLKKDATGNKISLRRLVQESIGEVLATGRYGLLTDFPASEKGLNKAQSEALNYQPRLYRYPAESIINWQYATIAGQTTLTKVVLLEAVATVADDGFTWSEEKRYRVLSLEEGVYRQYLFNEKEEIIMAYEPRKSDGSLWNEIPFNFIGSEDNDPIVDYIPLYDLAKLNIGHYRNSADYEESIHVVGQPTLMISSNMSVEEFEAANPNGILLGARRGHNLGAGGSALMLQAAPNQIAYEGMKLKEAQAVMIGARLVMSASSNETAEAARIKHSGENSVLATIVSNVGTAILQNIMWCLDFISTKENKEAVIFELNTVFFDETLDPQMLIAQIQLYNNGIIAPTDIRYSLRKTGLIAADRTDEEIDEEVGNMNPFGSYDGNQQ